MIRPSSHDESGESAHSATCFTVGALAGGGARFRRRFPFVGGSIVSRVVIVCFEGIPLRSFFLFIVFFGIGSGANQTLSPFQAAVIVWALISAACPYRDLPEVSLLAVKPGQFEASQALGLRPYQSKCA